MRGRRKGLGVSSIIGYTLLVYVIWHSAPLVILAVGALCAGLVAVAGGLMMAALGVGAAVVDALTSRPKIPRLPRS